MNSYKKSVVIATSILLTATFYINSSPAQGIGACFGFTNCTEKKYSVSGNNVADIKQQMNSLGPGNAWGQTRANFTGADTYTESQNSEGKFFIKSVQIEPALTITLPIWSGLNTASACLKQSWENMYSSLVNHEKKHAAIAIEHAKLMEQAALSTKPADSSESLKLAAFNNINPILNAHSKAQDKFDNDTNHGSKDPIDPIVFEDCN